MGVAAPSSRWGEGMRKGGRRFRTTKEIKIIKNKTEEEYSWLNKDNKRLQTSISEVPRIGIHNLDSYQFTAFKYDFSRVSGCSFEDSHPFIGVTKSGLLELAQPPSEGNLAYIKNFYWQAKIYGRIEDLIYRGETLQTISLGTIQAHYNLPNPLSVNMLRGERKRASYLTKKLRKPCVMLEQDGRCLQMMVDRATSTRGTSTTMPISGSTSGKEKIDVPDSKDDDDEMAEGD
ncbi:uncharacterized protein G2W53_003948 [Senna tora]|uniref:Uncharacterized protein n=1 Tax=Senna tora TaxID=362788 RepID=A0A835CIV9_9FABA|nr:uncharacterized protein G2W53_003948 [Senna tora]